MSTRALRRRRPHRTHAGATPRQHGGLDRAGPEALEQLAAARGARHARDAVTAREQLADGAPPDDAGGSVIAISFMPK
jgi:hypothetical protein